MNEFKHISNLNYEIQVMHIYNLFGLKVKLQVFEYDTILFSYFLHEKVEKSKVFTLAKHIFWLVYISTLRL